MGSYYHVSITALGNGFQVSAAHPGRGMKIWICPLKEVSRPRALNGSSSPWRSGVVKPRVELISQRVLV